MLFPIKRRGFYSFPVVCYDFILMIQEEICNHLRAPRQEVRSTDAESTATSANTSLIVRNHHLKNFVKRQCARFWREQEAKLCFSLAVEPAVATLD